VDPAARAQHLLDQLTLDEKIGMLDGDTAFWSGMIDTIRDDAYHRHPWPAGVVARVGIGGLHFVDGPRGVVLEGGATTFPAAIARGATWDPGLEERVGEAIGREARAFGANLVGSVCVNLLRHPGWGRAQETYGEDPVHVGLMGAAATRGVQQHAIACVKHFALNSIDGARFRVDVQASPRVLHEMYLPHFRACVDAGALAVMSAYNAVNGQWCGQSPALLTDILKKRWGFSGFVLTDFIFGLRDAEQAVLAGQDLEMPFRMMLAARLPDLVRSGRVPLERVDDAVLRMLRAQLSLPAEDGRYSARRWPEHVTLARDVATASIVLLKNDDAVLPLSGVGTVAVLGRLAVQPNLGDRGSSDTRPQEVVTPLAGLVAAAPDLTVSYDEGDDPRRAAALAARTDAALVVVGLDWRDEGEHIEPADIAPILRHAPPPDPLLRLGRSRLAPVWSRLTWLLSTVVGRRPGGTTAGFTAGDRTVLRLDPRQEALVRAVAAANPRTVVVLMGGGAIIAEAWRHVVPGILLLWYPGMQGGEALADIVLGRVAPSGRMPFSVPTLHEHLPPFDPRARRDEYDLWHGYRRLARDGRHAAFPFGFGLSYTTFRHDDLDARVDADARSLEIEVTVTNTGSMAGSDVVQVYVDVPGRLVERPRRMLAGFARVSLAPGEAERLGLTIPLRRLAYFDEDADGFTVEPGPHRVLVARHVEDGGALEATLTLPALTLGD
jgi:beta-glucosidase